MEFNGKKLKRMRTQRLMSVVELSKAIGAEPKSVYLWELDKSDPNHVEPTIASLKKIVTFFGVEPEIFYEDTV